MLGKCIAFILLTILFPLMVIIAMCIYIFSGSPIFYKHKRCGYNFKEFDVLKFRTMHSNNGPSVTNFKDKRITKIGRILRRYKFDELPQLINIIKGEMNFIGPRPEEIRIVLNNLEYFAYLNEIKPGISDISSIIFKDESTIYENIDISKYEDEILPVKSQLALITTNNHNMLQKSILLLLSLLVIIHHKLSLHIISRFFLPYEEIEFREKLNKLLSEQIF